MTASARVLLLCHGNVCRSPMAEVLLRSALAARGVSGVAVSSAGLGALVGRPIEPRAASALDRLGARGFAEHVARAYTADLARADLVLAATVDLRDEAIRRTPEVRPRAFTWKEAVTYAAELASEPTAGSGLASWVARLGGQRGLVHAEDGFDVTDPMGRSQRVFTAVAADIAASMESLADALAGVMSL